jgi:GntR family transcriptional regulator
MVEFRLDRQSFVPFYRQIMDVILSGLAAGTILPGEKLPTIRDLAVRLEVNPNTVVKAYSQLQLLGVLDTQQGSGVFVRPQAATPLSQEEKQRALESLCRDFLGRAQLQNIAIEDLIGHLRRMRAETQQT